nr:helix-turn-helix domain-containing protein [Clostridia bacterium]
MYLSKNIYLLRKQRRLTQEQLAETMNVSRQTISKWESGEMIPELQKLIELCDLFSCKLDALVREDMFADDDIYSPIAIRRLDAFRMARYLIVSPNPEDDVQAYVEAWAKRSGLLDFQPNAMRIGWDWPYVSSEQQNRFGLRGYAAAYVLPEGFITDCPGVEFADQAAADYAVITITEPHTAPFARIPKAYHKLLEYMQANGFKEKSHPDILSCFEHEYEKDGVHYMDVYIHVDSVVKTESFTSFS